MALVGEIFLGQVHAGATRALVDVSACRVAQDLTPLSGVAEVLLVELDIRQRLNAHIFEHLASLGAADAGLELDTLAGLEQVGRIELAVLGTTDNDPITLLERARARSVGVADAGQRGQGLQRGGDGVVFGGGRGHEAGLGRDTGLIGGLHRQVANFGADATLAAPDFGDGAAVDQVARQNKAHGQTLGGRLARHGRCHTGAAFVGNERTDEGGGAGRQQHRALNLQFAVLDVGQRCRTCAGARQARAHQRVDRGRQQVGWLPADGVERQGHTHRLAVGAHGALVGGGNVASVERLDGDIAQLGHDAAVVDESLRLAQDQVGGNHAASGDALATTTRGGGRGVGTGKDAGTLVDTHAQAAGLQTQAAGKGLGIHPHVVACDDRAHGH